MRAKPKRLRSMPFPAVRRGVDEVRGVLTAVKPTKSPGHCRGFGFRRRPEILVFGNQWGRAEPVIDTDPNQVEVGIVH